MGLYENNEKEYYSCLAASYLRGRAFRMGCTEMLPLPLLDKEPQQLTEEEKTLLPEWFQQENLKIYPFKKNHELLPRVKKVLGFLHAVQPENLLDVGSGRGAFIFPFLEKFPWVEVTSIDLLDHRVEVLQNIHCGGVERLRAVQADLCDQPFPGNSFDIVTLLEVLEHIPDVEKAVQAAVHMARRYIVVTVPSKPDNNPEHIHLLTKQRLTELFKNAGCTKLQFDGVLGHLFLVAAL